MSVTPIELPSKKTGRMRKGYFVDVCVTRLDGSRPRKQRRLMGVSRRAAVRYETELKSQLLSGDVGRKEEKEVPTLEGFKDRFLNSSRIVDHCRRKEQRNKESHLRLHLLPMFGDKRLDEITARDIDAYKTAKRGKLANKTINMHLSTLRMMLELAVKWEIIDRLPTFEWLPLVKKEREHLSFDAAEILIASADPEWRAMHAVALKCGLRLSELLALRWEDIDFEDGYIHVRRSYVEGDEGPPKNRKNRRVPMGDVVIAELLQHRHSRSALVFCRKDGTHLSKNQARRAIKRACKKAGIDPTSWHPLRHTYASHLGMRNAPFKSIQNFMGHSSADQTAHYMHLDPDVEREVAKLLDPSGSHVDIALTRVTN